MNEGRKFKIIFSLIFVILITVFALVNTFLKKEDFSNTQNYEVKGQTDTSGFPYIITLPPVVGYEGILYEYYVKSVDSNTDVEDLFVEYLDGPSWLSMEENVLRGVPPLGSSGSYKIVLRVSDGYNTSSQENYILIEEDDK